MRKQVLIVRNTSDEVIAVVEDSEGAKERIESTQPDLECETGFGVMSLEDFIEVIS